MPITPVRGLSTGIDIIDTLPGSIRKSSQFLTHLPKNPPKMLVESPYYSLSFSAKPITMGIGVG
jgi:hypothetical protein